MRGVAKGDGLSSIAAETGFFWQTLYDLPENATLKSARSNPEILLPGDQVSIPALESKWQPCATGARHVFRRRGVPVRFVLRLQTADGIALSGARFSLRIDDRVYEGTTAEDGLIAQWVQPAVRTGMLTIWPASDDLPAEVQWPVLIGTLDPIDAVTGVQSRLENLGYSCNGERGTIGAGTALAVRSFQRFHGLPETGEIDDAFRAKLAAVYGV